MTARSQSGFTLVELIVVVAIIGIITAISTPSFLEWRRIFEYRQAARIITSQLREAKGKAINSNLQHRVEFETGSNRYRITRGNQAYNSSSWIDVIQDWSSMPMGVVLNATPANLNVSFNPNGTTSGGTVNIRDTAGVNKFQIVVGVSGRIAINRQY